MTKIISKNTNIAMLTAIAAVCLWYGISLYSAISKASSLKSIKSEIATLSADAASLQAKYLSLSKSVITPQILSKYGFREGVATAYISKTSSLGRAISSGLGL